MANEGGSFVVLGTLCAEKDIFWGSKGAQKRVVLPKGIYR